MSSFPQESCSQCDALWRSYGAAAAEHLKLLARAREAVTSPGEGLCEAIEMAGDRRTAARDAIYQHAAHPLHGSALPWKASGYGPAGAE